MWRFWVCSGLSCQCSRQPAVKGAGRFRRLENECMTLNISRAIAIVTSLERYFPPSALILRHYESSTDVNCVIRILLGASSHTANG